MGLKWKIFLVAAVALWSLRGRADEVSCLPEYTSLRAQADLQATPMQTFVLRSEGSKGLFDSKVRLDVSLNEQGDQLRLKFYWDHSFEGVSLPYNLFSVLVIQNGVPAGWLDFSSDCQNPGVGFFPGQSFSPSPVKVDGHAGKQFKFIVWGRIN